MSEYPRCSGSDNVDEVAWYDENSKADPSSWLKKPNVFGLYDIVEMFGSGYGIIRSILCDSVLNPRNLQSPTSYPGASPDNLPRYVERRTAALRPAVPYYNIGFRLARISPNYVDLVLHSSVDFASLARYRSIPRSQPFCHPVNPSSSQL